MVNTRMQMATVVTVVISCSPHYAPLTGAREIIADDITSAIAECRAIKKQYQGYVALSDRRPLTDEERGQMRSLRLHYNEIGCKEVNGSILAHEGTTTRPPSATRPPTAPTNPTVKPPSATKPSTPTKPPTTQTSPTLLPSPMPLGVEPEQQSSQVDKDK